MSFDGQVLCQRMLMGPWALTTAGAAIVEAAPTAATFRKRRRVEVLSLVGVGMASSPVLTGPWRNRVFFVGWEPRGFGRGLGRLVWGMRRFECAHKLRAHPRRR